MKCELLVKNNTFISVKANRANQFLTINFFNLKFNLYKKQNNLPGAMKTEVFYWSTVIWTDVFITPIQSLISPIVDLLS